MGHEDSASLAILCIYKAVGCMMLDGTEPTPTVENVGDLRIRPSKPMIRIHVRPATDPVVSRIAIAAVGANRRQGFRSIFTAMMIGMLMMCGMATLPLAMAAAQEHVSFPTSDGGIVSADLYGRGPRGIVLAHGGRLDKSSWSVQADALAKQGFRVLVIDFRGRGDSRGGRAGTDGVHYDVLGAVQYLRETGAVSVSAVGASFGGKAVADAALAAGAPLFDRIVLLAHSPIDHPERLAGRKLFLVSRGDATAAGIPRLVAIRSQYEHAPEPKELVVVEGTAHAQFLFQTDQRDRVWQEILQFLVSP